MAAHKLTPEEIDTMFDRLTETLKSLDRAGKPTISDLMMEVGAPPMLAPGQRCPFCGYQRHKTRAGDDKRIGRKRNKP